MGTGAEVIGAELIETAQADAEFECRGFGCKQFGAHLGEEMADQR